MMGFKGIMESENEEALRLAEKEMRDLLRYRGPYTHNILGMLLRTIAEKLGKPCANRLIKKYGLKKLGFEPEGETK
jgi:hypothetical protein